MNSLLRSKPALILIAFVLITLAATVSLVSPVLSSHASSSSTAVSPLTPTLPPTWFQLAPSGGPPTARSAFARAVGYDQTNNRMIFFGGLDANNNLYNDTWVLVGADGTSVGPQWVQLTTVNPPAARYSHTAAYDSVNNILVMYGGCLGFCAPIDNNVYTLSHANGLGGTPTWTQLSTTGGPPPQRDGATSVYDSTSNSLIIFGGDNCCGTRYNDTWVLSNANGLGSGTPTWAQLSTVGGPPPARVAHSAVYDTTNNRMIIFGGYSSSALNDTWVLSHANGLGGPSTWTQLAPTGTLPPVRSNHGAVYNASSKKMIIFGGAGSAGFLNDIWTLSHANGLGGTPAWKQAVPVSTSPSARNEFITVYNTSTHRMIIFGGSDATGDVNDTWVLLNVS